MFKRVFSSTRHFPCGLSQISIDIGRINCQEKRCLVILDIYQLALMEAKIASQKYEFTKASNTFKYIIHSIPSLNIHSTVLQNILAEAYVQEGIILSKGSTQEAEQAFQNFKKAVDLDLHNKLAKEKLLAMQYERGEIKE